MDKRIKYSILIPYYNRAGQLHNTFISYVHHYKDRDDYEVVLIEDAKTVCDKVEHEKLNSVLNTFSSKLTLVRLLDDRPDLYNPGRLFNKLFNNSKGEFIVLTCAEVFHKDNVLNWFDYEFDRDKNVYAVCTTAYCRNCKMFISNFEDFDYEISHWCEHIDIGLYCRHFCSAMHRNNYDKLGGFNEIFNNGIAFEDDEFKDRAIGLLPVVNDVNIVVVHQDHDRELQETNNKKFLELAEINRQHYAILRSKLAVRTINLNLTKC
jgi:hypothetical protein